ncbi:hypothetical protein WDU94_015522 [Cyamophila willieti]
MIELLTKYIPQAFRVFRILKCIVREHYEYAILEGSQVMKEDQKIGVALDAAGYYDVDLSEMSIVSLMMVTSMLAVSTYCLLTVEHHLHKQRKFYDQLLKINEKLNLETLKDTCSMLIDRYVIYNALRSVDQVLLKSGQTANVRSSILSEERKVQELKSQIQQIQNGNETLCDRKLVQRVSDICSCVESFHRLNGTDSIDMKVAHMKECSPTRTKIYENVDEESWDKLDTSKMAHNERGDQIIDLTTDNSNDNIENVKDTLNTDEIENQPKGKGKICLKKPYDVKKIKCRKLAANTSLVRGKEKTYDIARNSFIMKQLHDTKTKPSRALLNRVNSKTLNIGQKNLTNLISNQSKDSLKSLATSVIRSQEKVNRKPPVESKASARPVVNSSHSAKTSEFKMKNQQRDTSETLLCLQKREDNSSLITQKKITNEQIKRRLERGYNKLRKASESRRDVLD